MEAERCRIPGVFVDWWNEGVRSVLEVWDSRRGHREATGLASLRVQRGDGSMGLEFGSCWVLRLRLIAKDPGS